MKKLRIVLVILLLVGSITGAILYYAGVFNPTGAGLRIETIPASTVYINGEQVGKTPYSEVHEPGEVDVKLVPDSFERPLVPYEGRIKLASGVETILTREFGESETLASGDIISFEEVSRDEVSLTVVSVPDSAQISIDGVVKGFAPFKTTNVTEGEHVLMLSANGYNDRTLNIKTFKGYKLTAYVQLSPNPDVDVADEEKKEDVKKVVVTMVKIFSTPTDFLRVRADATTGSKEVGRVTPDETYNFLGETEKSDWFEIEFEDDDGEIVSGWVSGTYAEKIEIEKDEDVSGVDTNPTPSEE